MWWSQHYILHRQDLSIHWTFLDAQWSLTISDDIFNTIERPGTEQI